MSPLPWLHHHDIMTIVGLFMLIRHIYIYIHTIRTSRDVGALKVANCWKQCVVVEWSGRAVRVRVRARAREWNFSHLFFFFSV